MEALARSYRHCRAVARRRAKNFYYSFLLLPRPQRDAMCAVYAFMRYCDDLSDEPGASHAAIQAWRRSLDAALAGRYGEHPAWPAFHDAVRRYRIPHDYFYQMIQGVESDLEPRRIATFDELYRYCYQVASVVGLTIIHIFGFQSPEAPLLAERCGIAFQLTNILRDIPEDAGRGRIYLPAEDLARFGVAEHDLREGRPTPAVLALLGFELERARSYYRAAEPLVSLVNRPSRPSLRALVAIYSRLLDRIERSGCDVFSRRIAVPTIEKAWLLLRALAG